MAETISRAEYSYGQFACVTPDRVRTGFYSVRRERLSPGDNEKFATELFIRILGIDVSGDFPRILVADLDDDGTPLGTSEFVMDPDGIIVDAGWYESGYLVGLMEPDDDSPDMTKAALFAPVIVRHEVQVPEPARRQALPLPE